MKNFKELDMFVDEETIKSKYYIIQSEICTLYIQWFRQKQDDGTYKRYGDVYVSKNCVVKMERMMKKMKMKFPIRYTS